MTTIAKNRQFKKMDFIGKIGVIIGIAVSLFMAIFLLFSILLMTIFIQSDNKIELKKVIFFAIVQSIVLVGAICNIIFSILYINQKADKIFVGVMNIIFAAIVPGILILMEDVVSKNSDKNDEDIIPKEIQPGKLTHLGSILGLFFNTISIFLFAFLLGIILQ